MIAEELINQMIPTLQPEDEAEKALYWMDEMHASELPVVYQDEYQGLLERKTVIGSEKTNEHFVSDFSLSSKSVFALPHQHLYDVLKLAEDNNVQMVAVVNEDKKYYGVITISDTLAAFAQNHVQQELGSTLVLQMPERDYSLSEISRLVESNDAKILSSYVSSDNFEHDHIKLTIKINRVDITRVIATFERFNYKIVAKYQQAVTSDADKERFDLLMKYLNI